MAQGYRVGVGWVQWLALLATLLGGIWTVGGLVARMQQQVRDNVEELRRQTEEINELRNLYLSLAEKTR